MRRYSRFDIVLEEVMNLLLESRKDDYVAKLSAASVADPEGVANYLVGWNNTKKERLALNWLMNGTIKLPADESKMEQAWKIMQRLTGPESDISKYNGPDDLIDGKSERLQKIGVKTKDFDPDKEPTFSLMESYSNGLKIYLITSDKSKQKDAQQAVRNAMDVSWGPDDNPWCLTNTTLEGGLDGAFKYWSLYSKYPKRIAFKNNKLIALSAGRDHDANDYPSLVTWWDHQNHAHGRIGSIVELSDDPDKRFIRKYLLPKDLMLHISETGTEYSYTDDDLVEAISTAKVPLADLKVILNYKRVTPEIIKRIFTAIKDPDIKATFERALAASHLFKIDERLKQDILSSGSSNVKLMLAKNFDTPLDKIEALAKDKNLSVRTAAAKTRAGILSTQDVINSGDIEANARVVRNPKTPDALAYQIVDKYGEDDEIKRAFLDRFGYDLEEVRPDVVSYILSTISIEGLSEYRFIWSEKRMTPEFAEIICRRAPGTVAWHQCESLIQWFAKYFKDSTITKLIQSKSSRLLIEVCKSRERPLTEQHHNMIIDAAIELKDAMVINELCAYRRAELSKATISRILKINPEEFRLYTRLIDGTNRMLMDELNSRKNDR